MNTFDKRTKIYVTGITTDWVSLKFNYNEDLIFEVKKLSTRDRRYDAERKYWLVRTQCIPGLYQRLDQDLYDLSDLGKAVRLCANAAGNRLQNQNSAVMQPSLIPAAGVQPQPYINKIEGYVDYKKRRVLESNAFELTTVDPNRYESITLNYPEKCTVTPYEHQEYGARILVGEKKFILADTMGLGKTLTSIIAAYNVPGRKLIICPASLRLNWRNELVRFGIPREDILVISDGKTLRERLSDDIQWTIINYDNLRTIPQVMPLRSWSRRFGVAIFDEAHYCKSVTASGKPKADRGKNAMEIAQNIRYLYLLSGTPLSNHTCDIYLLLKMIGAKVADNWYDFANVYCDAHMDYHWKYDGASNMDVLHKRLTHYMLRRKTEDVLQLPEKIRSYIPCEAEMKEYEAEMKAYYEAKEDPDDSFCALAALQKLKRALARGKVKETIALAKDLVENDQPVVIYTCYVDVAKTIAKAFSKTSTMVIGEMNGEERQKSVDDFQAGKKKVIVLTVGAGSVGLTLTKSNIVMFNDFDYVASSMRQAEDRIWRIGQRNSCSILYVYADNCDMDDTLKNMLDKKLTTIGSVIDGKAESLVSEEDNDARNVLAQRLMALKKKRLEKPKRGRKKKVQDE